MKFMIYGNSPDVMTGYGVQIAHLCRQLKKAGHDVAVACTFGHQTGVRKWATPDGPVTLYPSGWLENSIDVLVPHTMHFFGGDPHGGYLISLTDQWVLLPVDLSMFKVIAWTPVDHWPCPPQVLTFCQRPNVHAVAMSKFGHGQLSEAGVMADYAPLAVDTTLYKPTTHVEIGGEMVPAREMLDIPESADFVVAMVGMSKDPNDRKGFNAAFRAFGRFWREHQNSVLYVHSDKFGLAGSMLNMSELAKHAAIPPHAIVFTNPYALQMGWSPQMMAALYTTADVLLSPSKGEGFCVPLIEAQACGTPVIVSDFTAQPELVGCGWKIGGSLEFDTHQSASYMNADISAVAQALMAAYDKKDNPDTDKAIEFAAAYSVERVYAEHWAPIIDGLAVSEPAADKPKMRLVDVIVPYVRPSNTKRLTESFKATNDGSAHLVYGQTAKDKKRRSYAENVNDALTRSDADWVFVCGDDVEFTPGWLEAARELSDRYDVIGTNDSTPERIRNPLVANGSHADHFFVRRSYIDEEGASLEGPGILTPEVYRHWYVDREIIELAKARGVFAPCLESVVIHHHPGYDGNEAARDADPLYSAAVAGADADLKTWIKRAPLVAGHRGR